MMRSVAIGLLMVAACAGASSPAHAAPASFAVSGTLANSCKIGSSTSYAVSIVWVKNSSVQISLDGTAGNTATSAATSTATHSYATFCNGPKTLTMSLPTAAVTYTMTVKDDSGTTIATATSAAGTVTANVAVPVTNSTWSITASAVQANGGANSGTYTATVTIQ